MYTRFDEFSINTNTFELMIGRELVQSDERVFLLFELLIERYPAHCGKQECLDHIWYDTVVSNMSLAKLVSDTRKLFKQAGCEVPIIQTIHGRGYRLSAELGTQLSSQNSLLETPQAVTNVPKLASEGIMFKGDRANLDVNMTGGENPNFSAIQGASFIRQNTREPMTIFARLRVRKGNLIVIFLILSCIAILLFHHH
ncbi:MAG: DNA-binding winged helix-turn-helix (wHTH) protein [Shewanella sp.]|jgi:DNA-binding winged helix-turn-helix (wHTH) protein